MRKITVAIYTLLSISGISLQGQEIQRPFKDVVPPSPTVANLMRFEEVPVNLYTGSPSISIPLFQKNLGGGLSMGLQLSYNTSGIRIDERSGWTGTGWSLMAGGSISRTIKDLPDEINNTGTKVGTFHNGYHTWDTMSATDKDEFLWKTSAGTEKYDSQIDVFQFNFMGKTGRFSIVRNGSNQLEAKLISRSEKIKIDFTPDANGAISQFKLTDALGFQYVFGSDGTNTAIESTQSEGIYTSKSQFGTTSSPTSFDNVPITSNSAWHLMSVRLPNNEVLATLHYKTVDEGYETPMMYKQNHLISTLNGFDYNSGSSDGSYNRGVFLPASISTVNEVTVTSKKLERIDFNDGTDIFLETTSGHPEYESTSNGVKLSRVSLRDETNTTLQYFDFTYTTSTPQRLFLTKLSHKAGAESQDYDLQYDDMHSLPAFGSHKKDQWGFYNKDNNESSYGDPHYADHADVNEVTTGVLTAIDYPTGGTKSFIYESNAFSFIGNEAVDPTLIPQNATSHTKFRTLNAVAAQATGTNSLIFYINHDHTARLTQSNHVFGTEVEVDKQKIRLEPVIDNTGNYSTDPDSLQIFFASDFSHDTGGRSNIDMNITNTGQTTNQTVGLETGWYKMYIIASPSYQTGSGTTNISVKAEVDYRNYAVLQNYMYGAGIRIKEVQFKNGSDVENSTKYSYNIPDSTGYSSGSFDGLLLHSRNHKITRNHLISMGGYNSVGFQYEVDEERNALYTSADKSHYIGYRNVRKEQTGNGYTDYQISSPREYPSFGTSYGYPFAPVEDQSFKTSLTLEEEVFNENDQPLIKKTNDYLNTSEDVVRSIWMFEKQHGGCAWNILYDSHYSYLNLLADNNPAGIQGPVALNCGSASSFLGGIPRWEKGTRADLIETEQTEYFPDQPTLSKTSRQTFSYNSTNWQISQKRDFLFEAGTEYQYTTNFYYPHSYPASFYTAGEQTDLGNMISNDNKYNELIATQTTREEAGVPLSQDTLNIVVNKYSGSGGSNYRLKSYHVAETPASAATLEERYEVVSYDAYGNPLEVKQTGGVSVAYAWGYGSTLPVINAQNTTATALDAAISTAIGNTALPTGVNTLQDLLDHVGDLSTPDQRGDWATFSQKLNEHLGNQAHASTMTYHTTYGITSQTSPNGISTFFEYDSFGRLQYVKDHDGNILKANEYAYKVNANTTQN